jgi:hypothetical protein
MTTNLNGRRITTREATVRTAAVEIKSLTVSGRQVTLSLFRQLLKEPVIDPDTCELRGVPWGTVNYFWPGCGFNPDVTHLHVVWQKGDELRRACVGKTWPLLSDYYADERAARNQHAGRVNTVAAEVEDPLRLYALDRWESLEWNEQRQLVLSVGGWTFRRDEGFAWPAEQLKTWPPESERRPRPVYRQAGRVPETETAEQVGVRVKEGRDRLVRSLTDRRERLLKEINAPPDGVAAWAEDWVRAWGERYQAIKAEPDPGEAIKLEWTRLNKAYTDAYTAIAALDQLFIAA